MPNDMENNRRVCRMEKEAREKRLLAYAETVQKSTLEVTSQIIKEFVIRKLTCQNHSAEV